MATIIGGSLGVRQQFFSELQALLSKYQTELQLPQGVTPALVTLVKDQEVALLHAAKEESIEAEKGRDGAIVRSALAMVPEAEAPAPDALAALPEGTVSFAFARTASCKTCLRTWIGGKLVHLCT